MVHEYTPLFFEEYFWHDVDSDNKVILDAGTGFGISTSEIASRVYFQKLEGRIISVDIDPQSFELARNRLKEKGLIDLVTFVKADLSCMPEIRNESVDLIVPTRTVSINYFMSLN